MDYEWDENKRLRTLKVRGLDFRDAQYLFDGRFVFTYPSPRSEETRFVTIGLLEGHLLAVVWMERSGARRIISIRRARDAEERTYHSLLS